MDGFLLLCGGQESTLTFQDALRIAHTKSAAAQEAKSAYKISTLDYEIYRANLRPSLSLTLTPGRYNRSIVQRYDFESNQDIYRTQQTLFSSGRLILNQQVPFTGGNVFLYSDLQSYQTFGKSGYTQFTSAPLVLDPLLIPNWGYDTKPSINMEFEMEEEAEVKQLTLF